MALVLCAPMLKSAVPVQNVSTPLSGFRQKVWNTSEGLPQNTVPAILQSSNGYIWAGTELGLVRFDGLHFTVFDKNNTPELKSNAIYTLLEDHKGDLWVGTVGGGLTKFSKTGRPQTFTTANGLANDTIRCLLEDRWGDLWIGTDGNGVSRLHNGRFSSLTTADGLADDQVFALTEDRAGALWIGTHNGLSRYRDGVFRTFRMVNGLGGNYVRCLLTSTRAQPSDDVLWIGTDGGGLTRLEKGQFTRFSIRNGLTSNAVFALAEDTARNIWIGTRAGGIMRLLSNGVLQTYTARDGLPANDVWALRFDHEGDLWVGLGGGGLVRLVDHHLFTTYDHHYGLSSDVTLPILQDHTGAIWVGTNGGGLNRFLNRRFSSFTTKDGLASNLVFSLAEARDGGLWVGTRNGLSRFKDGKFKNLTKKDGLPNESITALRVDSRGILWVGTRGGLSRYNNQEFVNYTTREGLSNDAVQTIFEDRQHRIWIGTAGGGLNLLENDRFHVYDSRRGLSNNVVFSLNQTEDGAIWIGTNGGGLNRLKNGRLTSFTTRDGLPDDAIFRILEDASGALWMSSNKGIFRVSISALDDFARHKISRIPALLYGRADGMNTRECNGGFQPAGWKSRDGHLWFPTMQGIVTVDPSRLAKGVSQQATLLETILINGQEAQSKDEVELPVGAGELEFRYSAPNFHSPNRIQFRYKLESFDKNWVHAGSRRTAYYTNIPPGHYRFIVGATNEDGTWSHAVAALAIRLKPHFYQTIFFYVLCAAGLALMIFSAHLAHVRRLREREKVLASHVDDRTADLRREIAERQRAEEDSVKAREVAERANRVKSEFLANMSHEIRTPMNGIVGMTRLALATPLDPAQHQYMEIIRDSADSLLTLIDDILDFSKVEAGKLELDPIDFELRQSLRSAVRSLEFRAEQKGIGLSFEIDEDVPAAIHADPVRLRQILLNLLGNAVKFTSQGDVMLIAKCDAIEGDRATLHFIVRDAGIGIAADKLKLIFEAFSQADSSTTREFGGTGLGLAICNRLVQLMGGSIWATSELGHGSEFHFTIQSRIAGQPAAADDDHPHQQSLAALAKACGVNRNILLAEDNPANRLVARLTLEGSGFKVSEVANGREALDAARRDSFDLILMDCRMPVMDGYDAAREIRRLPEKASRTPIIALTASAFKEDRIRAKEAGMDDFVAKPFEDGDLIAKCLLWTGDRRRSADDAAAPPLTIDNHDHFAKYSPEFLKSILEIFLETAPPAYGTLLTALDNHDWEQARSSAHFLKGGAARLLGQGLQTQLEAIESACASPSPAIAADHVELLETAFGAARTAAESWLAEDRAFVS